MRFVFSFVMIRLRIVLREFSKTRYSRQLLKLFSYNREIDVLVRFRNLNMKSGPDDTSGLIFAYEQGSVLTGSLSC